MIDVIARLLTVLAPRLAARIRHIREG